MSDQLFVLQATHLDPCDCPAAVCHSAYVHGYVRRCLNESSCKSLRNQIELCAPSLRTLCPQPRQLRVKSHRGGVGCFQRLKRTQKKSKIIAQYWQDTWKDESTDWNAELLLKSTLDGRIWNLSLEALILRSLYARIPAYQLILVWSGHLSTFPLFVLLL